MAFKIVLFATLLAATQASHLAYDDIAAPLEYTSISVPTVQRYLHQSAPIVTKVLEQGPAPIYTKVHHEPIVAPVTKTHVQPGPAEYDFGYSVDNPYDTHHQNRVESRRGDFVTGSYSVLDADGFHRVVDYTAHPLEGFRAVVRKNGVIV
ncbi:unnamed protein product [Brassicogethes aeneus]|uniref:Uncharacterized protein n=1 Tax=Brassicogethes aeneus TaxID=1431903 RepID=A0A9P0AWZ8_BRAAE|nr:unnamed protein product [Brassicogethes aeneus]